MMKRRHLRLVRPLPDTPPPSNTYADWQAARTPAPVARLTQADLRRARAVVLGPNHLCAVEDRIEWRDIFGLSDDA